MSAYGPEFEALRAKARAKIKAGRLPAKPVSLQVHGDSKHQDYCRVCDTVIELHEKLWYRLTNDPNTGKPDPELHIDCYMAWNAEMLSLQAGEWSVDP
jgi:hypothetical protein